VADKIEYLLRAIPEDATQAVDFEELFATAASREEVVVTFLALLELMRLRELCVRQSEPFASIQIFRSVRTTVAVATS
jgi:segregation and condensation protein A